MATPVKILGIPGSLRKASYNRAALRAASEMLPDGTTLEIADIGQIPLFNEETEKTPPTAVVEFKSRIKAADAILFATPEYNYSISGVLKNAFDWGTRPYGESAWTGKPAAIMGASVGLLGTARAQYHLRQILVSQNMQTVNQPEIMIGNASQGFDKEGKLTDEATRKFIKLLVENLVALTRKMRE